MKPKLIELINYLYEEEQRTWEVYMDKELSEGCLLKIFNRDELDKVIYDESYDINDDDDIYIPTFYWYATEAKYKLEWHEKDDWVIDKILWHLWLSSILKYVEHVSWCEDLEVTVRLDNLEIWNRYWVEDYTIYWYIPNTELHLMSDQELENVITLLKKLDIDLDYPADYIYDLLNLWEK